MVIVYFLISVDATLIDSHRDMILPLFQINEDLLNLCNDLHIYKK